MIPVSRALGPLALAIIASWLMPGVARATDNPEKIAAAVDRAFRPLLQAHDVPGMAVAVTANGKQYFFTYGVASKETGAPVTKDTLFEIGSISKPFTATLAALAQVQGKLSLDDRPSKYMPELRDRAIDKASLLHLATFTAGGLPLHFPKAVVDQTTAVAWLQNWKPSAAPGGQRRYSNPSIGLFGHLTARAMNRDFAELVETELFRKLGMSHSFIRMPKAQPANFAWGYKAGKPTRAMSGVFDAEAYGVKSSAADLIRYVEANIRPDTLDPPLRRAIEATHTGYFRIGEMVQGLGWEQYSWPVALEKLLAGNSSSMIFDAQTATQLAPPQTPSQPALFNKTGSTIGFGAYVAFVPAQKIGIVMLANRNFPLAARITAAHAVLEQLASKAP